MAASKQGGAHVGAFEGGNDAVNEVIDAEYALHLACANIVFVVEAPETM